MVVVVEVLGEADAAALGDAPVAGVIVAPAAGVVLAVGAAGVVLAVVAAAGLDAVVGAGVGVVLAAAGLDVAFVFGEVAGLVLVLGDALAFASASFDFLFRRELFVASGAALVAGLVDGRFVLGVVVAGVFFLFDFFSDFVVVGFVMAGVVAGA